MATPYANQVARGGVTFQPRPAVQQQQPDRVLLGNMARLAAAQDQQQAGSSRLSAMAARAAATPQGQKRREEQAKAAWEAAQQEALNARPWYQKGLGMVVGNPVSKALLSGAEYLSYPRKAIEVGISELATALPEWVEKTPVGFGLRWVDEAKVRNDERDPWERIRDPEYGFGQFARSTGNKWGDRYVGFVGDVALDPTSYVAGPTMKAVEGAEVAAKGAQAASKLDDLARATSQLDELTRIAGAAEAEGALGSGLGWMDEMARAQSAVSDAKRASDAAKAEYEASKLLPGAMQRVPVHANRAGRLQELQQLGARMPEEWMRRNLPEIERIAQRGMGAAKTPEVREALGLLEPRLQFLGADIPLTGPLAKGVQRSGGMIRGGLNRSGVGTALSRGSIGTEEEIADLIGRQAGKGDTYRALAKLYGRGALAEGREVEGRANQLLREFRATDLKSRSPAALEQMVKQAESKSAGVTPLNRVFKKLSEIYMDVTGRDITPFLQDEASYFPHMLTTRGRRALADESNKEAQAIRRALDFQTVDLMEGSGYLEKSRKLVPNADGSPAIYKIGDRSITVRDGGVHELNRELNKAFPEFGKDFKFFETNPEVVIEAYGSSLAKGAGRDIAARRLAESKYPFVQTITGDIERQRAEMEQALLRQDPRAEAVMSGQYTPTRGEIMRSGGNVPAVPESEIFRTGENVAATKAKAASLANTPEALGFGQSAKDAAQRGREQLISTIGQKRQPLIEDLKATVAQIDEAAAAERSGIVNLKDAKKAYRKLRGEAARLTTSAQATQTNLARWVMDMQDEIAALEEQLARETKNLGRRLTRAESNARELLKAKIETYRQIEQDLTSKLESVVDPELYREWELRRAKLNRPVEEARIALKNIEKTIPPPPEGINEARRVLAGETHRPPTAAELARVGELQREHFSAEAVLRGTSATDAEKAAARKTQSRVKQTIARMEKDREIAGGMTRERAAQIKHSYDIWFQQKEAAIKDAKKVLELAERQRRGAQEAIVENMQGQRLWERQPYEGPRTVRPLPPNEQPPVAAFAEPDINLETVERIRESGRMAAPGTHINAPYPLSTPPTEEESLLRLKEIAGMEPRGMRGRRDILRQKIIDETVGAPETIAKATAPIREEGEQLISRLGEDASSRYEALDAVLTSGKVEIEKMQEAATAATAEANHAATQIARSEDSNAVATADLQRLKKAQDRAERNVAKVSQTPKGKKATGDLKEIQRTMVKPIEDVIKTGTVNEPAMAQTVSLLNEAATQSLQIENAIFSEKMAQRMIDDASKGTVQKVMMPVLNENWKMLYEGVPKTGDIIMDAELHRRFQNLFELQKEPTWFGRTFNALTNLFKTYATMSPGFHVRNSLGGIFMNTSDGVALRSQFEGARLWRGFLKDGEAFLEKQPKEIRDAFRATFATGAGGRYTEAGVVMGLPEFKNLPQSLENAYGRVMNNPITRASQRSGNAVEGSLRLGMALDSIKKGESVQEAIIRINRIHFDYADVSKLDKSMKQLIPFWTFMSRNLPMQVSQMWSKPRTYQIYENFVRNFASPNEPNTPQYWLDSGGFNTGLKLAGMPMYLNPDLGYQQIKGQTQMLEDALSGEDSTRLLSTMNPLLTAPAEYMTRKDFFTGQEFPKDQGFAKAEGVLAPLMTALATVTHNTNEMGQIDPRFANAIRAVAPPLDRLMRLTPSALAVDQGTGTDKRQLESWLRFFGLPVRQLTPEQQRNEALRRHYELVDEQKRRREMMATAAAS